jgi:hypothetical protein
LRLKRSVIDSLAKFGQEGISAIEKIIKCSKSSKLKEYGLDTIDSILYERKTSQVSFLNMVNK